MEDQFIIRIKIADRYYPITINRNDEQEEEKMRKAASKINDTILRYKQTFEEKNEDNGEFKGDTQDYLAMTALQFTKLFIESCDRYDISPIIDNIKELNQELGEYIEKE